MWAIRKASFRIKSQPFSLVAFRACYGKLEPATSTHTDSTGFGEPPPNISDSFGLIKKYSWAHGTQSSLMRNHNFSTQAGTDSSGEETDDFNNDSENVKHESDHELVAEADLSESESENELDSLDTEEEVAGDTHKGRRGSSDLFRILVNSPLMSVQKALDKWTLEGHDLSRSEISEAIFELRRRKMYGKALQLSEWLESEKKVEFGQRDYASRVDLLAKIKGIQTAEAYIEKIPASFRGEIVYRTLLANCVMKTLTAKAEQVFNRMKSLNLPITAFTCNQLLLLYKRTDKRKIADVLLLMEKENIKPSLFTYRMLIETKGQSNDITGMEKILETMKSEGLEPDLRLQAVLAQQYVYRGIKEKAKEVLKEMEGSNLNENRRVCSSLLPIYALLGSFDDVKRVWEVCKPNPRVDECMKAIDAFGKLKKVEEAEVVFDQMSKKWGKLSSKHYASMMKVYANNKMLSKGKDIVKQMSDSGCRIGPLTWDALVKLYLESGEVEKADSILNKASQQIQAKPLFNTYMMILDQYARRGDVHNAERVFYRMRRDGYVSRYRQYYSLLQAYINAKVPAYGFKERLKADNVFPSKSLAAQLVQVDAFKKTPVSDLLD